MIEIAIIFVIGTIIIIGSPKHSKRIEKLLSDNSFVDKNGNPPILTAYSTSGKTIIYEFFSDKMPISIYESKKDLLETIFNLKIISITNSSDKQHILVKCTNQHKFPNIVNWDDSFIHKDKPDEFVLNLGVNETGNETLDISSTPHILLAGSTGSGKTILFKQILYQCYKKQAAVIIVDLKGGIDFYDWKEKCKIITALSEIDILLQELVEEKNRRTELLVNAKCPNISEYNKTAQEPLNRIIFACDEFAEIFDHSSNKELKPVINRISDNINSIARLGRAFGIHLLISTQRPSADVINGQLKNNLGFRACGRADNILSRIVLDDTSAADEVQNIDQGVFVTNFNTKFKAYYLKQFNL